MLNTFVDTLYIKNGAPEIVQIKLITNVLCYMYIISVRLRLFMQFGLMKHSQCLCPVQFLRDFQIQNKNCNTERCLKSITDGRNVKKKKIKNFSVTTQACLRI